MVIVSFLINLLLFQIPAAPFAVLAWRMSRNSRDEWKLLAWVPVLPLAIWGGIVAFAVTRDPTSHNLWPFEAVFWGALGAALLGLFALGRRLAARAEQNRDPFRATRRPPKAP
jgi:hypothetical protein